MIIAVLAGSLSLTHYRYTVVSNMATVNNRLFDLGIALNVLVVFLWLNLSMASASPIPAQIMDGIHNPFGGPPGIFGLPDITTLLQSTPYFEG